VAFELLVDTPPLLRKGQYITFTGGWPEASLKKEGDWFRVTAAQQVKYDVNRLVASGSSLDLSFEIPAGGDVSNTALSLLPMSSETCYELLIGLKGNCLVYPMYDNSYFLRLEATNVIPDTSLERRRYLGNYDEDDSPFERPRLREHVVKDQVPPVLRVYNDMFTDEPMIFRFWVNRLRLEKVARPAEDIVRVARIADYFRAFQYQR